MDTGYYNLRIVGDGTVEFEGRSWVLLPGKHHGAISGAEFQKLVDAFRDADFFSLPESDDLSVCDAAPTTFSIAIGGQEKDEQGKTALQIAELGLRNAREGYRIDGYQRTIDLLRHARSN